MLKVPNATINNWLLPKWVTLPGVVTSDLQSADPGVWQAWNSLVLPVPPLPVLQGSSASTWNSLNSSDVDHCASDLGFLKLCFR